MGHIHHKMSQKVTVPAELGQSRTKWANQRQEVIFDGDDGENLQ